MNPASLRNFIIGRLCSFPLRVPIPRVSKDLSTRRLPSRRSINRENVLYLDASHAEVDHKLGFPRIQKETKGIDYPVVFALRFDSSYSVASLWNQLKSR